MVLGLRTKNKKGTSIHVDYIIHIQDIKPWPPSQSLKSLRSVLIQWENGERSSGSTNAVVPSIGAGVGDGKIEFNESFRLSVTLSRDISVQGGNSDVFLKNCLELNLYEPRRDKTVKGQLLGMVVVDLAEYGVLKETVLISASMNCKRNFRNTAQPLLYIKIQPFDKHSSSTSSRGSLSKEVSLDNDDRESVSALMNGDYSEEAEIASFTDDDMSSHSTLNTPSSAIEAAKDSPPFEKNALESAKKVGVKDVTHLLVKNEVKAVSAAQKQLNGGSSHSSSIDLSSGAGSPENDQASFSNLDKSSRLYIKQSVTQSIHSSSSSLPYESPYESPEEEFACNISRQSSDCKDSVQEFHEKFTNGKSEIKGNVQHNVKENNTTFLNTKPADIDLQVVSRNNSQSDLMQDKDGRRLGENGQKEQTGNDEDHSTEIDGSRKAGPFVGNTIPSERGIGLSSKSLRQVKSVRSPIDLARNNGSASNDLFMEEVEEIDSIEDAHTGDKSFRPKEGKDVTSASRETRTNLPDNKVQQLEQKIEKLERELREAASLEVSLYSIVAEHGSSANKVHAPARRLSRLYLHACRHWSQASRASAARSAISGLVFVAKACGNDVPRLTFWLSNSVVLRAIISFSLGDPQVPGSAGLHVKSNGMGNGKRSSSLKWKDSSPSKKANEFNFSETLDNWEDPQKFTAALEKIEAWMFSRIIESVWWQALTPHMQSASKESEQISSSLAKDHGKIAISSDQEQAAFSLELWKKAFKDACERLCPVRAAGHECGCLPMLARLVMEQCVSRLDVAMFNAILRPSADEVPTDPVSDPISDLNVLPIPVGKSSFGAGAQLKNAIGNWSRWLTDLFGIDDDDCHKDENEIGEDQRQECETSSKSFHLLHALSDLMMLPKDMLVNRSIKKEVCPLFGAPLIKIILDKFSPDEFCPDPIPEEVFEALDAEDPLEVEEDSLSTFPCSAAPVTYSPPPVASLASIIGEVGNEAHLRRSGSLLRKSYTSDDELDELDSPLTSITDSFRNASKTPGWKQNQNRSSNAVRYQLLQEVWREGD